MDNNLSKSNSPSDQRTRQPTTSNWVAMALPYLLGVWCCLAFLQGSSSNIPELGSIATTVAVVLAGIAAIHLMLAIVIHQSPARELVLFVVVVAVGMFGGIDHSLRPIIGVLGSAILWTALMATLAVVFHRNAQQKFINGLIPVVVFGLSITVILQIFGITVPVTSDQMQIGAFVDELTDSNPVTESQSQPLAQHQATQPDIYYIIVDAYARADVLDSVYQFDNQPFLNQLADRGFHIGDEARSNYHLTELSLASSLNMTHLHGLGLDRFKTRLPIRRMIKESRVVDLLQSKGYQTVGFETGKSDTECTDFDKFIPLKGGLTDYQDVLYHRSLMPTIVNATQWVPSADRQHGDRVIEAMQMIPEVVDPQAKPTFVFSHMLAPHPPFVFNAKGEHVELHGHYLLADGTSFSSCYDYDVNIYRDAYREQLAFINQKLIEMVDRIKSKDRSSLIIIQGDHGPRLGFAVNPELSKDPQWVAQQTDPLMRYREGFSILNAIHVPENIQPKFYSGMTPVNTFKILFNAVFDMNLAMDSDESFMEDDYTFTNETERAKSLPKPEVRGLAKHRTQTTN